MEWWEGQEWTGRSGPGNKKIRSKLRLDMWIHCGGICHWCRESMTYPARSRHNDDPDFPTFEHIVPHHRGGKFTPGENIVLAHMKCNSARSEKDPLVIKMRRKHRRKKFFMKIWGWIKHKFNPDYLRYVKRLWLRRFYTTFLDRYPPGYRITLKDVRRDIRRGTTYRIPDNYKVSVGRRRLSVQQISLEGRRDDTGDMLSANAAEG